MEKDRTHDEFYQETYSGNDLPSLLSRMDCSLMGHKAYFEEACLPLWRNEATIMTITIEMLRSDIVNHRRPDEKFYQNYIDQLRRIRSQKGAYIEAAQRSAKMAREVEQQATSEAANMAFILGMLSGTSSTASTNRQSGTITILRNGFVQSICDVRQPTIYCH
jgi:hypothetical protein